jgi:hypothetical protein
LAKTSPTQKGKETNLSEIFKYLFEHQEMLWGYNFEDKGKIFSLRAVTLRLFLMQTQERNVGLMFLVHTGLTFF